MREGGRGVREGGNEKRKGGREGVCVEKSKMSNSIDLHIRFIRIMSLRL